MVIEPVQDEQTARLLSQANLHRMRQQWDEAITACMQALYHAPENWRAHALLGDIYADQNRPDEAIQWYCMTLDIRPESNSVREKLSKLVNTRRHEIVQSIDPTRSFKARTGRYPGGKLGASFAAYNLSSNRRKMGVAAAAIGIIALIAVPVVVSSQSAKQQAKTTPPPFVTGSSPTNTNLYLQPITVGPKSDGDAAVDLGPPVPAPVGILQPTPGQSSMQSGGNASSVRDVSDQSLTSSMQSDPGLSAMRIQVSDAQINPSNGTLTITYVSGGMASPSAQSRDMHDGIVIAKAALIRREAAAVSSITVRCLTSDNTVSNAPTLTFVGDLSRTSLSTIGADISNFTPSQLISVYSDVWWAPGQAPLQ